MLAHKINVLLFFLTNLCLAQTYVQQIDRCNESFKSESDLDKIQSQINQFCECAKGLQLPSFYAQDIYGKYYAPEEIAGKVVLISYCFNDGICELENSKLIVLNKKFSGRDFTILSFYGNDKESMFDLINHTNPFPFPIFANASELMEDKFKMRQIGYPIKILVNRKSQIMQVVSGTASESAIQEINANIEEELSR